MAQAVQGRARRCATRPKKWAAKNSKDRRKCGQSANLGELRSKIRCESNSRRTEYEQGNSATDCKGRFGNEKFSAKIVPRILTHDQIQRRLHISSDLLRNAEMFDRVITGDETWCFQYDPETKRQSMQWKKNRIHLGRTKHACLGCRSRPRLCVSSITRG